MISILVAAFLAQSPLVTQCGAAVCVGPQTGTSATNLGGLILSTQPGLVKDGGEVFLTPAQTTVPLGLRGNQAGASTTPDVIIGSLNSDRTSAGCLASIQAGTSQVACVDGLGIFYGQGFQSADGGSVVIGNVNLLTASYVDAGTAVAVGGSAGGLLKASAVCMGGFDQTLACTNAQLAYVVGSPNTVYLQNLSTGKNVTIDNNGLNVNGTLAVTGNVTGAITFGTAPNLGSTVTGAWTPFASGLLVSATNYGAFQISQSITNVKFRQVSCSHGTAGAGTAGTLAIRNVTDSTTLCSGSYTCTTTANTPTAIFDCNAAPLASKQYAVQFSTGCGTTQVSNMGCTIEIAH